MRIGVFDSGLGGLTVVKALLSSLSDTEILYIADTLHAPYGEKSHDEIRRFSLEITQYFIERHHIDALVIACNTATSAAIEMLRERFPDLPIVGTEPGIKPALHLTQTHKVGILATPATLAGDKYQELADRLYNGTRVTLYEQACPGLVEQIETGRVEMSETVAMLEGWLSPMREAGVDTIVLGCTHYPLAEEAIKQTMGYPVTLIETGEAIAKRLRSLLDFPFTGKVAMLKVFATGKIDRKAVGRIVGGRVSVLPLDIVSDYAANLKKFIQDIQQNTIIRNEVAIGTLSDPIRNKLLDYGVKIESREIFLSVKAYNHMLRDIKVKRGKSVSHEMIENFSSTLENPEAVYIDAAKHRINLVYLGHQWDILYKIVVKPNYRRGKRVCNAIITSGLIKEGDMKHTMFKKII